MGDGKSGIRRTAPTVVGKKVKRLRREGRVPGIVYGPVVEGTVPVSVDRREFLKFYQANGHSTLFVLRWEDGDQSVFIREVQQRSGSPRAGSRRLLRTELADAGRGRSCRSSSTIQSKVIDGMLAEIRTEVEVEALPAQNSAPDRHRRVDADSPRRRDPGGRSQFAAGCDRGHGRGRDDRCRSRRFTRSRKRRPKRLRGGARRARWRRIRRRGGSSRDWAGDSRRSQPDANAERLCQKNEGRTLSGPRSLASREPCLSGERPPP